MRFLSKSNRSVGREMLYSVFYVTAICCALISSVYSVSAAEPAAAFGNDGIDRTDPNFVTASLLVMSQGLLLEGGVK